MLKISLFFPVILLILSFALTLSQNPSDDLSLRLNLIVEERQLSGLQLKVTKNGQGIFYHDRGIKNTKNEPIDNRTMFIVASLSKSVVGVGILQLVEKGLIKLNDPISKIFGFAIKNPNFPNVDITVYMLLCHYSSIGQGEPYYSNFINATQNATDGYSIPSLKEILLPGGKYYSPSMYFSDRKPGEYFRYSNLGYAMAGTIIEIVSKQRFDLYVKQNILDYISQDEVQNATFNPATIKNLSNLGTIFQGVDGKWMPSKDNYTGSIQQKNLTGYVIGTNAGVYGPSDSLRASMHHMGNYMEMLRKRGVTKSGKRILSEQSVAQLQKPRYQYHGPAFGNKGIFHLYGFGIHTTTYLNDTIIDHQILRGHLGNAYNLRSASYYWKDYTFSYIMTGAMNPYETNSSSIYEVERGLIHSAVNDYLIQAQNRAIKDDILEIQ